MQEALVRDSNSTKGQWLPSGMSFLSGLPTEARKRRLILTVQAYIDESGTKGTHPILVLAGFLGRAEKWAEFSDRWRAALAAPPKIEYLKMREAAKLKGQFDGWQKPARDRKLAALVKILKNYPQRAIHATIDLAAFQERMAPHLPKPQSDPYFVAFYSVMAGVCYEVLDTGVPDKIEIIFDRHVIFEPRVNLWYPLLREAWIEFHDPALRVLPSAPRFEDDKEFLPLQAADVLAWMFRMAYSGQRTDVEWIAEELAPHIPMSEYASIFDADRMDRIYVKSFEYKFPPQVIARWRESLGLRPMSKSEFDKFVGLTNKLLEVPHDVIKTKIDAEKQAKKRKKSRRSSASREPNAKD